MNSKALPEVIKNHLYNIAGWRTKRKIIVMESDDWGSIRMRSKKDFNELSKKEIISTNHYNSIDCLETEIDLEELYNCLLSFKDTYGNSPKITANFVTTNPDFDKISNSDFERYYYETFPQSYKKYNESEKAFTLVQEGIRKNIIFPQFHGREHLQVEYWMKDLKLRKTEAIEGFKHCFFGFGKNELDGQGYLSSFNAVTKSDIEPVKKRIKEGLDIFESIFGFKSQSVIAPQNTMHYELLPSLKEFGVEVIQGARINKQYPINKGDKTKYKRFMGQTNAHGQINIVRNATFEPSFGKIDWVEKCLKEIEIAFFWQKPAVICSHRVNYMGGLDKNNRDRGLHDLENLLNKVLKKWPDIEFLSTVELAQNIKLNQKH